MQSTRPVLSELTPFARTRPTLEALIPCEALDLPAIQRQPIAGFPKKAAASTRHINADEFEAFQSNWRPNFLREVTLGDGSSLAYCNKTNPHAQYDNMIIQTDCDLRTRVCDLSPAQVHYVFGHALKFVEFVSERETIERFDLAGGRLHLVFNTDPHTRDRENGMGYTKRFHLHMNYWPLRQLDGGAVTSLSEIADPVQRRRLLDPLTVVGGRLIREIAEREGLFKDHQIIADPHAVRLPGRLPAGFVVRLSSGWNTLKSLSFLDDLKHLDQAIAQAYGRIQSAITGHGAPAEDWRRHDLLDRNIRRSNLQALPFSAESVEALLTLSEILRPLSPRLLTRFKSHGPARKRHLAMNGVNYSTGLFAMQQNTAGKPLIGAHAVYLVIQPKLFSDVGGAGIIYTDHAAIIELARQAREFTPAEAASRNGFHQAFLGRIE